MMQAEKILAEPTINGGVHLSQRHDSAHKHVTGLAEYTDDIPEPAGTLHAYLGLTTGRTRRSCRSTSTRCAPRPVSWAC